jgi:transposase
MDVVVQRCAGLDVHRDDVVATVRVPGAGRRRWDQQTRTFRATLAGLSELAEWLAEARVTLVGMEATGVYWKPVFQALEQRFECWLLNAHHLHNVPGRRPTSKTPNGSASSCSTGSCARASCRHRRSAGCAISRGCARRRSTSARVRSSGSRRCYKTPASSSPALRRTPTQSPRARSLEALLSGVTEPDRLAELAKSRMRAKIPQLREALASRFAIEHHGVMVVQLLAHIDTLDGAIENLNERIELVLAPHAEIVELLCTIPGVQTHAAQVLIAVCGLDMSVFPTVAHFASWAGACPGHHESAGRRRSGQTRPGPRWLTDALTEAAKAAARTKGTYLAAHFAQLRGRRGEPKAIGAIRHDLLVAYYHIVRDRVPYRELGPDWQCKRYSVEHRARRLQRQLEALGYKVTVEATAEVQPAA